MLEAVRSELLSNGYDIVIMADAVADYAPVKKSDKKIDSRAGKLTIDLIKTDKIVDKVRSIAKNVTLVAFKADHDVTQDVLIRKAYQKLKESDADYVVANDVGKVARRAGPDRNEVFVIDTDRKVIHLGLASKNAIAKKLLGIVSDGDGRVR